MKRGFEFALKDGEKAFKDARLPVYATNRSAGADFFCAEDVTIPSIWTSVAKYVGNIVNIKSDKDTDIIKPTLVHTGVKACMEDDEVLEIYTRSSMPKKVGVVLANSVGIVDADYYNNPSNDGEIMFAYYNIRPFDVTIKAGDRIGQGIFKKFLKPTFNLEVEESDREGGFGSTGV